VATAAAGADRLRVPSRLFRAFAAVTTLLVVIAGVAFGPHLADRAWHSFIKGPGPRPTRAVRLAGANPTQRLSGLSGNRYPLWRAAAHEFQAHPLDGTGAGTFQFWWNQHATDTEFVRDTHNIWLQNMAELGVPGLLLIVLVTASVLGVGLSVRRRVGGNVSAGAATACLAAFAVYLVHASVDWMWQSTAVTVLALAAMAVLAARLSSRPVRLPIVGRAGCVLVALAAGAIQLPGILSTTAIRHSQAAERAGQLGLAYAWAQDAVGAGGWSASAYEQRGLVLESAGHLPQAAADLRRAISLEPQSYEHWLVLARVETERGDLRVAVAAYDRARALRPMAAVFRPLARRRGRR
jgi:O-antigen ligase